MRLITKVIRILRAKFHCNRLTTVQDIQDYASLNFLAHSVCVCRLLFLLCYACISVAYAIMQCLSACPSVCSSICPSRTCILSKRINISSKFFHHWVATPFWFSTLSVMAIFDRNPPNGGHQMGRWVGKNCDFRPVSGFIACCQWFDH